MTELGWAPYAAPESDAAEVEAPKPDEEAPQDEAPSGHVCPECGKSFERLQALGGHRYRSHGIKSEERLRRERLGLAPRKRTKAQAAPTKAQRNRVVHGPSDVADVQAIRLLVASVVEPAQQKLDQIERRLADLDRERDELKEARRELSAIMTRLDLKDVGATKSSAKVTTRPSSKKKSNGVKNGARMVAERNLVEKTNALEQILRTKSREDFPDGFTSNQIANAYSKQVPRGLSTQSVRQALERLRDRGVVRHDRVIRGGGMRFKLVTSTTGGNDEQASST